MNKDRRALRREYRLGDQETLALEARYYDGIEGRYEPLAEQDYEAILASLVPISSPASILEVGCGSGAFGRRLQRRLRSRVNVGLDISYHLLSLHPFMPVLGTGQALPFKNESFSFIAACAALHHIHNLYGTIDEIFRCLEARGRVIFVEPNADHPHRRLMVDGGLLHEHLLRTSDESIYPDDLVKIMHSIGFRKMVFEYRTFQNSRPSILGHIQFKLSQLPRPAWLDRYVHPWFVLVGEK